MEAPYWAIVGVIVSGIFALIVSLVSNLVIVKITNKKHKRERFEKIEKIYADTLEGIYKYTQRKNIDVDFPKIQAQLVLVSTKEIIEQFKKVGETLQNWKHEYDFGEPKPLGDSGYVLYQSGDSEHQKSAAKLYELYHPEMVKFETLIKDHLKILYKM